MELQGKIRWASAGTMPNGRWRMLWRSIRLRAVADNDAGAARPGYRVALPSLPVAIDYQAALAARHRVQFQMPDDDAVALLKGRG